MARLSKSHNNTIPTSLSLYKIVDKDGEMIIDLASPLASLVFHYVPSLHSLYFRETIFQLVTAFYS